ncbi:High-affinity glutamine permease [Wickerhamomyces ciferrii]|uniref:High-affinity glutamine permease n=1 Tax=Wickerhamomyces ciferrii (strain ATCC 14091 / BCRC 22168 / CBS 111 / JCM 3599 / NBRC 0793 / NRRL Y-1031 F-60-10) TaxID=1206466 RepID=K0KII4_WICCF|nr:High-affinity glutamine permease [Wickerhamomyces ciferrii]CCH41992.1 High-affinity glutamine permease [Wickerhamomyces ciferrii]
MFSFNRRHGSSNSNSIDLEKEKKPEEFNDQSLRNLNSSDSQGEEGSVTAIHTTHRSLNSRTINLIAIGGSVGTALFVTISGGLLNGGPANLFIAYTIWSCVMFTIIASIGEMVCYLPITAPFIQMAGRCVDEAFEAIVGMNYWLMTSINIAFEITAVNSMISFWRDDYSPAITFVLQIFIYTLLNVFAVRYFGESEFWLSLGKLILAIGLILFTFVTMVGGNPQHDAYGFRYWNNPGPMVEYLTGGSMGRFHGFMAAMNKAVFTCVGPEYLCMVAGETGQETRKVLAKSFRTVFYRLFVFYVLGSLCVSVLLASNDATLVKLAETNGGSNGAFSPYVIAMNNMKIKVLPHIVNALCVTSAFSAGNSYVYCSSRSLLALSYNGFAPKFLQYCTKNGVPIFCIGVSFCFSLLSLLQLGSSSGKALTWIVNVTASAQIANYFLMSITYMGFWRACQAQGVDKSTFRYRSWFQPYTILIGMFLTLCMVCAFGYIVLMPGRWDVGTFLTSYLMILLDVVVFIGYKLIKRTKFVNPAEADIFTGIEEVEQHELNYLEQRERLGLDVNPSIWQRIMNWIF